LPTAGRGLAARFKAFKTLVFSFACPRPDHPADESFSSSCSFWEEIYLQLEFSSGKYFSLRLGRLRWVCFTLINYRNPELGFFARGARLQFHFSRNVVSLTVVKGFLIDLRTQFSISPPSHWSSPTFPRQPRCFKSLLSLPFVEVGSTSWASAHTFVRVCDAFCGRVVLKWSSHGIPSACV